MDNKVSVIVPVYKVEKYLNYCVASVVNQSYKNLEIILVDDGSPDNCPKMCDEWAKKDERIKVIHKENGGLSSARNEGIKVATGEYISFIDSDDTIHPQTFEILMAFSGRETSDIVMSSWKKVYEIDKPNNEIYDISSLYGESFTGEEVFDLLFNKKVPLIMAAWAKLYKISLFEDIIYPEGKIHEDEYIIHEILTKTNKLSFVDLPLYNNTQRTDSITAKKNFSVRHLDAVEAKKLRWEFCKEHKPEYEQKALSQYLVTIACYYTKFKIAKANKQILVELKREFDEKYKLLKNKNFIVQLFKFSKFGFKMALMIKERGEI